MATTDIVLEPSPGLYRGVEFDTYVSWDAANSHILNEFSRTPAHVYHSMLHGGKGRTMALDLGWYLHIAVLEPKRFGAECAIAPVADRRTKLGKALWARFEAENAGKYLLDHDTHAKVTAMKEAVYRHPAAREFLEGRGQSELSILWEDKEHGVRCKARIDRVGQIGEWPVVGDFKTARNAGREAFGRQAWLYGYDVQAVHYLSGLETLVSVPDGRPYRRFIHIVVENEPPHCVALYELDDATLEEGRIKRSRYLRKWRECVTSGKWPGYPEGIESASLPAFAFRNYVDE